MKTHDFFRLQGLISVLFFLLAGVFHPSYAQWNPNTSVNLLISNLPTADMQSVATTDGKTWIAYYHENAGNYDMRAQLIDANGFKLLGPDGILVSNQPSGTATFVFNVCVDGSNNLILGFQYEINGTLNAVVFKISQSGTQLWGNNGVVLGPGLAPYPAALSTGEVVVVWNADAGSTLNLHKITTSGTLAWTTPVAVTVGSSKTTRGQVISNTGGKFSMVFQKMAGGISTTLYAQQYNASGTALYPPLQICNQTTSGARYYSVAAEGDTVYCGYYSSVGLRFNSFLQRINPNGTIPWGMNGVNFNTSVSTNDPYQGTTVINLAAGSPYVWSFCTFSNPNQTQYGVFVQKFLKSSGARQFTDAAKTVYAISSSADTQVGEIVLVNDAPMFMSVNSSYKIFAARLDASGNFVWPGNRVEISSTTATMSNGKMRFGFTNDGPDRCIGVWTEKREANYMGYAQGISVGGLTGLIVATQGGVPAVINASGGTLQMVATVYPSTANQAVTWSLIPGTGMATISAAGLVTAQANGTVWAKASAVQDITVKDSMLINISGQTVVNPVINTLPATGVSSGNATLNGSVTANTYPTTVSFEWGTSTAYGNVIDATPQIVSGTSSVPVTASLSGLLTGITYHFRCKGVNTAGTFYGQDQVFQLLTGTEEPESGQWTIFPVPSDGIISVSGTGLVSGKVSMVVLNPVGKVVFSSEKSFSGTLSEQQIDLTNQADGLYMLVISNGHSRIAKKIMLSH